MANMTFKTNLMPNSSQEYNLGSSEKKWNIYGDLLGSTSATDLTVGSIQVNGSANFTGIPTSQTPNLSSNGREIATTAFVREAFNVLDAMQFKGVIDNPNSLPNSYEKGWTYRVSASNVYAGEYCETGDILIAIEDNSSVAVTQNNDWAKIEHNIDGALFIGHNSTTSNSILVLDSGQAVKTISGNNDEALVWNGGPTFVSINPNISLNAATSTGSDEISISVLGITPNAIKLSKATTSNYGTTILDDDINSNASNKAATANAVNTVYSFAQNVNSIAENHKYWANIEATSNANYGTSPEIAVLKLNGDASAAAASSKSVSLQYNSTNETLSFVFV